MRIDVFAFQAVGKTLVMLAQQGHVEGVVVDAALDELGVDVEEVLELGGWRTNGRGVAVAFVPFPDGR